jgi:hypothetical protein
MLALPIFAINPIIQRKVARFIRRAFSFIFVVNITLGSAMAAYGYSGDDVGFNIVAFSFQVCLFATMVIFSGIISYYARGLELTIKSAKHERAEEFISKINAMRMGSVQVVLGQFPTVIGCIVFIVIGNLPFFWIWSFLQVIFTAPSFLQPTTKLFKTPINNEHVESPHANNLHTQLAKISTALSMFKRISPLPGRNGEEAIKNAGSAQKQATSSLYVASNGDVRQQTVKITERTRMPKTVLSPGTSELKDSPRNSERSLVVSHETLLSWVDRNVALNL